MLPTLLFYVGLLYFLNGGKFKSAFSDRLFLGNDKAKVVVFSYFLIFWLWDKPHYRSGTFQQDMLKNLRNVAVPGTRIPLSFFARSKFLAFFAVMILLPISCLVGAIVKVLLTKPEKKEDFDLFLTISSIYDCYTNHLLDPTDWFFFWSNNCRLSSLQALITKAPGFILEDKWTFLVEAEKHGIPVTPVMSNPPSLIVKNTNEEGGLGFCRYDNCMHGGNWILQERIDNSDFIKSMLPDESPLSTLRIVTCSNWFLHNDVNAAPMAFRDNSAKKGDERDLDNFEISAIVSVWRAGREFAITDHKSVLFDVDISTGELKRGTDNSHWYNTGLSSFASSSSSTSLISLSHSITHHPDDPSKLISTKTLPDMSKMVDVVVQGHLKLFPDVPLAGWDVAMTDKGIMILEANLSCNFFRGTFNREKYFGFVKECIEFLDEKR